MDKKQTILLIERDKNLSDFMEKALNEINIRVAKASGSYEALQMIKLYKFDIVVLGQDLPLIASSELLKLIRKSNKHIPVIVLVDKDSKNKENLLYLMKGSFDYLIKPIEVEVLKEKVKSILYSEEILNRINAVRKRLKENYGFDEIIGKCSKMIDVFESMIKVANSNVTIFIGGESGTGKELVAREIHKNSPRKDKTFIVINCAAIPDNLLESELFGYEKGAFTGAYNDKTGKFELADKGTIFLDEIGDMSLHLQAKILRLIEEQEFERVGGNRTIKVNVRIISATNKNLEEEVKKGNFRNDLYYRLKVFPIYLPPLRERKEDISLLVGYFIKKMTIKNNKELKYISPEGLNLLENYSWPGNIRELENVIERAVLISQNNILKIEDFSILWEQSNEIIDEFAKGTIFKDIEFEGEIFPMEDIEKKYLKYALKLSKGNVSKAAKKLKIGRTTLYRKLEKYNLIN